MKNLRSWSAAIRTLVVLALVPVNIAGVAKNVVATARETGLINKTTYLNVYLDATGKEVVWDDSWESDDEILETGDGLEIFALNAGSSGLLISVLPNGLDTKGSRHIVLEEFAAGADEVATIDRGAHENISYSLDLANVGGTELGAFTLFRGGSGNTPTFAHIFIGPIQEFGDGFASSQEVIAIPALDMLMAERYTGLALSNRYCQRFSTLPLMSAKRCARLKPHSQRGPERVAS